MHDCIHDMQALWTTNSQTLSSSDNYMEPGSFDYAKTEEIKKKNKQEEREINRTERDKKAPNTNCNSSQISVRKSLHKHLMFRAWGWKGKPTWKICGVSLLLFFSFSSSSMCDTDSSKPLFT